MHFATKSQDQTPLFDAVNIYAFCYKITGSTPLSDVHLAMKYLLTFTLLYFTNTADDQANRLCADRFLQHCGTTVFTPVGGTGHPGAHLDCMYAEPLSRIDVGVASPDSLS